MEGRFIGKQTSRGVWTRSGGLILPFFLCGALAVSAVTFTASLERDTISIGDSTSLQLTFDGAQPETPPNLPDVPNLQIRYVGPASQVSFVNGRVSSRITHNYSITPKQAGDYTIPSISADVNGQRLATQPVQLHVSPPSAPPRDAESASRELAFMRLVVPRTNIYLGEIVLGTYELYLRDGVSGWANLQFTSQSAEGVTLGKTVEGQQRRVQLGSASFTVVPLAFTITPIKTGPITIGPVTATISYTQRPRNQSEMFFGAPRVPVSLATDALALQCSPVPSEQAPRGFGGAVGNYSMNVSVGPTNVAAGDPITVRVEITGRGALDGLALPEQAAWQNFKTYPPTSKVDYSDQLGMSGTKTFEQIISPENSDLHELPPLQFSFFDPNTGNFRTLTQPATPLTVRPGGATVLPMIAAKAKGQESSQPPPQQDIVPLKQRLGPVRSRPGSAVVTPTFVALNLTPALALLGVFVWRKRSDALANNPRLRRYRLVSSLIETGLVKLRELAAQNKSDEFFAELMRLLQEKLGERLDLPAVAITESVIDQNLKPRGLPDTTCELLHELFQATNLARFAPVRSSAELAAFIPRLERVLRKLEEVPV